MVDFEKSKAAFFELLTSIDTKPKAIVAPSADQAKYQTVVAAFYSKAARTFRSIALLCANKSAEDAAVLARSLFETMIHLLYITKDREKRAVLFIEYEFIAKKRLLDKLREGEAKGEPWETKVLAQADSQIIREIENEYKRVEANYPIKNAWSGKTLKQLIADLKLDWDYKFLYWHLSTLAHPDPIGINKYVEITDDAVHICFDSSQEDINRVWRMACMSFLMILTAYDDVFKLGFEDRIEELHEMISATQ